MSAPKEIADLINRFEMHYEKYVSPKYIEAEVRSEFIDPFFEALGWDVSNRTGADENYKDVLRETRESSGAPDYAFRYGERIRFYVEAKKPSINIEDSAKSSYQLRNYAWNSHLSLSILTDFEEFAVYDCRYEPKSDDRPDVGRILFMTFREYIDRWDEIDSIFSKRAILQGSFDKYVNATKDKRGSKQVDDKFLEDINKWRKLLAQNLAHRNTLTVSEVNVAVQNTINRLIFLRICEDRSIESYGQLQKISENKGIYVKLIDLFKWADKKYNSGLFHFAYEPRRAAPDRLTPELDVDDKVLQAVISGLYPPSPYRFEVISAEILGQVYEQFLGDVIRLTEGGHTAKIELKPEVKKAGGVVYTPSFIVNYIVEHTVGKWLEGKSPKDVEQLKILDLACGSGAFLLGAYRKLLAWHLDWWASHLSPLLDAKISLTSAEITKILPAQSTPAITRKVKARMAAVNLPIYKAGDRWKLTLAERKRILLNSIYGVDIDPQAVEVTKLSLLLKVLEDESSEAVQTLKRWSGDRALPDLSDYIKCGNSLVDTDIELDDIVYGLVKPFNWETEFPEVLAAGGFNIILGNPPYVRQETLGKIKGYFQTHYKVYQGTADLYSYFVERSQEILRSGGHFGMIISNKWLRANYGKLLRQWLKEQRIEEIVDFEDLPVFENATTYPCILRFSKDSPDTSFKVTKVKTLDYVSLNDYVNANCYDVNRSSLDDEGWSLVNEATQRLLAKVKTKGVPLSEYVDGKIYRGIVTGLNTAFVIDSETKEKLIDEDPKSAEIIKPFLVGKDIKRYNSPSSDRYVIFTRRGVKIENYPAVKRHLILYKPRLRPQPKGWMGGKWEGRKPGDYQWYEIQDSVEYHAEFEKPKILWPGISSEVSAFALDLDCYYGNDNNQLIISDDLYLLGILNSRLTRFILTTICDKVQGGFYRLKIIYVERLPIHAVNLSDPQDVARHDHIVSLVDSMLSMHKQLAKTRTDFEQALLQRQIEATDKQIDTLVYELYGLTEEEINIVQEL